MGKSLSKPAFDIRMMGEVDRVDLQLGDIVQCKKSHPCGSDRWEIMRVGMDIRIRCLGCGRVVMLPRAKFEKTVKQIMERKSQANLDTGQ